MCQRHLLADMTTITQVRLGPAWIAVCNPHTEVLAVTNGEVTYPVMTETLIEDIIDRHTDMRDAFREALTKVMQREGIQIHGLQ